MGESGQRLSSSTYKKESFFLTASCIDENLMMVKLDQRLHDEGLGGYRGI